MLTGSMLAGSMVTASNLVFCGTLDRWLKAVMLTVVKSYGNSRLDLVSLVMSSLTAIKASNTKACC